MNSNDRELLELAAKAAGHHVRYVSDGKGGGSFFMEPSQLWWNPLTDDGDALRLAVKLLLNIEYEGIVWVSYFNESCKSVSTVREPFGEDIQAATRRAIVRAAAEAGSQT